MDFIRDLFQSIDWDGVVIIALCSIPVLAVVLPYLIGRLIGAMGEHKAVYGAWARHMAPHRQRFEEAMREVRERAKASEDKR